MTGDNRGLYGQTESDAMGAHAMEMAIANVEAEGARKYAGVPTEYLYRLKIAQAAIDAITAERRENRTKTDHPSAIARIAARGVAGLRDEQRAAYQKMADLHAEMLANGFDIELAYKALALAVPTAYAFMNAAKGEVALESGDKRIGRIMNRNGRGKPKMYNPERDGLVNSDGSDRFSSQTLKPLVKGKD